MRLTEKDIGKKVKHNECIGTLIGLHGDYIWVRKEEYSYPDTWHNNNDFKIIEPPKLPSERIKEITRTYVHDFNVAPSTYEKAIVQFLDEQVREKK